MLSFSMDLCGNCCSFRELKLNIVDFPVQLNKTNFTPYISDD